MFYCSFVKRKWSTYKFRVMICTWHGLFIIKSLSEAEALLSYCEKLLPHAPPTGCYICCPTNRLLIFASPPTGCPYLPLHPPTGFHICLHSNRLLYLPSHQQAFIFTSPPTGFHICLPTNKLLYLPTHQQAFISASPPTGFYICLPTNRLLYLPPWNTYHINFFL